MQIRARHRRLAWIAAGVVLLGIAAALVLNAFRSNLVFFYTPSQVFADEAPKGRNFRIGGIVRLLARDAVTRLRGRNHVSGKTEDLRCPS